eukprot:COSAG04_NODE_275_length_18463_cov_71.053746_3_plen_200_part_00
MLTYERSTVSISGLPPRKLPRTKMLNLGVFTVVRRSLRHASSSTKLQIPGLGRGRSKRPAGLSVSPFLPRFRGRGGLCPSGQPCRPLCVPLLSVPTGDARHPTSHQHQRRSKSLLPCPEPHLEAVLQAGPLLTAAAFRAQNQMVPELAASKKALVQRLRTTKVSGRVPAPLLTRLLRACFDAEQRCRCRPGRRTSSTRR